MSSAPLGIFDSGIGGLTVAREVMALMPSEGIVYLGDTARVPYGTRSPETVRRYAVEGTRFLLGRGIKLLVVACNTVSAVGLDAVREAAGSVPVIGVIEPGARAAAGGHGPVGVIGTDATVRSGAYEAALRALEPGITVMSRPCPLFVPLVEEGWHSGDVPRLVAEEYLRDMKAGGIGTLVLGCTHYPLLKPVLEGVMGSGVRLIDSAEETARAVAAELAARGLGSSGSGEGIREFAVTDSPDKFASVGGRFLGHEMHGVNLIRLEA